MESRLATDEGEILDKTYRLVRLVAEGGMGLVYEATHARLAGRYAIKVLPPQWSKDPAAIARFDREARITSSLQHPNIVQIIDFNTAADGTEYLVMEYLEGETLAARLARLGPMSVDTALAIVEQVASGLSAAHAHGIVHRDLKPENVLLTQVEGREGDWAKILDFGISKLTGTNADTIGPGSESLIGTPLYMAPEQCEGRTKDVDAATDQFALAVLTYEMLTGRPPFAGASIGDVLLRVLHADPPPMNIDRRVEAVIRRGLAKASRQRYGSVTAFAEALRAAALNRGPRLVPEWDEESGSHAYAVGEMESLTLKMPPRRRSWAAGLIATAAVAAATVFVLRTAKAKLVVSEVVSAVRSAPGLVVPATAAATPEPPLSEIAARDDLRPSAADKADKEAPEDTRQPAAELAVVEPTAGATDAMNSAPAARPAVRAARTPVVQVARASSGRTIPAVAWTPSLRGSARAPAARPYLAPPAQLTPTPAPPAISPRQPPAFQAAPARPLPTDDDAILPLTEP